MSVAALHGPGACGCCAAPAPSTPEPIANRPGLSSIRYRVGTYASFYQSMVEEAARRPELRGWTARGDGDFGAALLALWAYLGDILTFYQERIANEAYLRTAILPESVRRLAALLDYRPLPGASAAVDLVFLAEPHKTATIPAGLRVQSTPAKGEPPQKFETGAALVAEARLNRIRIFSRPTPTNPFALGSVEGYLPLPAPGAPPSLAANDTLVFVVESSAGVAGAVEEKVVRSVVSEDRGLRVTWSPPLAADRSGARIYHWRRKFRLFGNNAPEEYLEPTLAPAEGAPAGSPLTRVDLNRRRTDFGFPGGTHLNLDTIVDDLRENIDVLITAPATPARTVSVPPRLTVPFTVTIGTTPSGTTPPTGITPVTGPFTAVTPIFVGAATRTLPAVPAVVATRGVTEITQGGARIMPIDAATDEPPAMAGTVTGLDLDTAAPAIGDVRQALVYELVGEEIQFLDFLPQDDLDGDTVYAHLTDLPSLPIGRRLVLDDGVAPPQTVTVTAAAPDDTDSAGGPDHLRITFTPPLSPELSLESAVLYGNVAPATHGETVAGEVLGDGDAALAFQAFALRKSPLTHFRAPGAAGGVAPALWLSVGGVRWEETPTLLGRGPDDQIYLVRHDEEQHTAIQFGDGANGARLPTGRSNVAATYRVGLGTAGNVAAGALNVLLTRPAGLRAVTNRAAASGGVEPEDHERTRENAPNTVRTFGRIVSLRDFEDAAREFVGVAKARAVWVWDGEEQVVRLTAAGPAGAVLGPTELKALRDDLDVRRDLHRTLRVVPHQRLPVEVSAVFQPDRRRVAEDVLATARTALLAYFSFERRGFGEAVHLSDVFRVLQDVPGVVAVDVNRLRRRDVTDAPQIEEHLPVGPSELAAIEDPVADLELLPG